MSAIRRVDRRPARNHQSSPYSRATAPKKSSWSISGLLNYIIPLRSRSPVAASPQVEQSNDLQDEHASAAQSLSARGHQMAHDLSPHGSPSPPQTQNTFNLHTLPTSTSAIPITPSNDASFSSDNNTPSPAKNLETVAAFLSQKAGQPLNQVEAAGLVALINQSTDNGDKPEPFRFSSSPPTPARGNSPFVDFMTPGSSNSTTIQTPRKTLSKNPNGVYRWEGGGSARPRNRYHSPAFGSPRSSSPKIRLSPPETARTDTKRRRVGEDASSSQYVSAPYTPPSRSTAPSPPSHPNGATAYPFPISNGASPAINGTTRQANEVPIPRLRTSNVPLKPTAPAIPSPLRQTWGQGESSSPPASRPTQAANFMTELIKEVTPPRKPDVSNPYQTASPVKSLFKKPVKRSRATGKSSAPAIIKEEVLSPQAIIEATVPKGSKRSRPPTNLEKSPNINSSSASTDPHHTLQPDHHPVNGINGTSNGRASPPPIVIEEVDEDQEDDRVAKKQKKTPLVNGFDHHAPKSFVTIEEIDDDDIPLTAPPIRPAQIIEISDQTSSKPVPPIPTSASAVNVPGSPQGSNRVLGVKSSAPKEPSKLRFSYQPDIQSAGGTAPSTKSTPQDEKKARQDPRKAALAMAVEDLQSFTFIVGGSFSVVAPRHVAARNAAKIAPVSSLPTFEFSSFFKSIDRTNARSATTALRGFDWAAAGAKPPVKPEAENWTCSLCMLSNPATAVNKCVVCEAPRIGQDTKAKPVASGFDWSAAGMKPPSKASEGTWTCSTCMLSNPATAVDKCSVCDTPR